MLVAGLDEAGRGPVIGSLVIGCVIWEEEKLKILDQIGVDDSKRLSPKKRRNFAEQIRANCVTSKILEVTASEINKLHAKGFTLNQIEEQNFAKLINSMDPKPDKIFLDAADVKEERFGQSIGKLLKFKPTEIISKHKGDSIFKIVGAASILAKTKRDEVIEQYKVKYGDIGSGYPSDPKTKRYLDEYYKKNRNFPEIVRTWWKTAENIVKLYSTPKKKQKKLTDF
jgi:ribonuclease HII